MIWGCMYVLGVEEPQVCDGRMNSYCSIAVFYLLSVRGSIGAIGVEII